MRPTAAPTTHQLTASVLPSLSGHPLAFDFARLSLFAPPVDRQPSDAPIHLPGQTSSLVLGPENVASTVASALTQRADSWPDRVPGGRLHLGDVGETVAGAFGAEAITIGRDVFFTDRCPPESVVRHEAAHVAQSLRRGPYASRSALEAEADRAAVAGTDVLTHPGPVASPGIILAHPALRVLLRAGGWLSRRTISTLSKHVARHGRMIAERAVHTVFRDPKKIKDLAQVAVREASALARQFANAPVGRAIHGGGVRVVRQATGTPGKFRYVVQKDFGRAIGTRGETILHLVLDQSGRVVTAFPVDRFLAAGIGVVGLDLFTARTAEASEEIRGKIEAYENRPTNWVDEVIELLLDAGSLGILSSSPANEGEDLSISIRNIVHRTALDTIAEIEEREHITLTEDQRAEIYQLAEIAVGAPMQFEEIEAETP